MKPRINALTHWLQNFRLLSTFIWTCVWQNGWVFNSYVSTIQNKQWNSDKRQGICESARTFGVPLCGIWGGGNLRDGICQLTPNTSTGRDTAWCRISFQQKQSFLTTKPGLDFSFLPTKIRKPSGSYRCLSPWCSILLESPSFVWIDRSVIFCFGYFTPCYSVFRIVYLHKTNALRGEKWELVTAAHALHV